MRHRAIDRKFKRRPSGGGSRHRSLDWQSGAAFTERPKRQRGSAGRIHKERGGRCPRVVGAAIGRLVSSVVVRRFQAEVAYLDYDAAGGQHGLAIIKPDGSDSRLVVPSVKNTTLMPTAWSDDGTELFYSSLDTGSTIRHHKRANGLDAYTRLVETATNTSFRAGSSMRLRRSGRRARRTQKTLPTNWSAT